MTDAPHPSEPEQDPTMAPAHRNPPTMPRWVKAFIVAVVLLVLLFVGSMLLGVRHGPARHGASGLDVAAVLHLAGPR